MTTALQLLDEGTSVAAVGAPLDRHVMRGATAAPKRPILRWHGGKWLLAPWILQHLPPHKVYVEPFGGAASVLLRKPRSYAEIYNDLDGDVVNLFRVARDRGDELRRALELTSFSRDEFVHAFEPTEEPLERARRIVTRSFMGFGSVAATGNKTGFRSSSNRSGTTPAHDWRNYPACFGDLVERLRGVCIENKDAIEVMLTHDSDETVHYVDPPYVMDTRDKGTDYRHELTDADHERLAETLHRLRGAVILSGYAGSLYERLFADWHRVERVALADGARERVEVLWLSRGCPQAGLFDTHNAELTGRLRSG